MTRSSHVFPIVGIGASAGGLDSFKRFLRHIPKNSGMAYVLVQHLDPSHESLLAEILSRTAQIPVQEITDDNRLEPDHIYIIPENKMLVVTDHLLKLSPRDKKVRNMPIDVFFSSLAEVHKTLAVGIVLSGTAHDGTLGLKAIKERGGITFAEDPKSAAWEGMPQSAVDEGVVDFVLSPEAIAEKLLQINAMYKSSQLWEDEKLPQGEEDVFRQILSLMRLHSGVDFNDYKQPTLKRRIARRMAINEIDKLGDYLNFLRDHRVEREALFHDMLIQVTSFFREPETFEELGRSVLPELVERKSDSTDSIRIWVAGCATGEEAYSLAIRFHEMMDGATDGHNFNARKIQIFASDISEAGIEKAREGIYSSTEVQSLSEERLNAYFTRNNHDYKIKKTIRDNIVFAQHNFLQDPPFAKMDLISCRNVFIYMDPFLQKKALSTFHYALNEHGFLLLGKAESSNIAPKLFKTISKQAKIFVRNPGQGRFVPPTPKLEGKEKPMKGATEELPVAARPDFKKSADAALISRHTPPSVVVDEHNEVVHINGTIAPFLEQSPGRPTFDLLKMARNGLGFELRNALHKAKTAQTVMIKEDIPLIIDNEQWLVSLEIIPLIDTMEPHYLVLFQKKIPPISSWDAFWKKLGQNFNRPGKSESQLRIMALEKELEQAREDMRAISEDQEATNEELQSANEEMLSSNEEMQSLNEELETSKEELQSTNEELIIINQELLDKQDQLHDALTYSEAIIATLREPLMVLDKNLNIETANAALYKKFGLTEEEIAGKSLFQIQHGQWNNDELRDMLDNILPKKEAIVDFGINLILNGSEKRDLLLNATEIVDGKKTDKLILFAIEDITERKKAIEDYKSLIVELKRTNDQLDQFVNVASHDLQEPLRKILTFSESMRTKGKGQLSEAMETYLQKIETSADRMATLIKDLLDFSRLTEYEKLFEPTDLNETVQVALADLELLIEQKQAELNIGQLPTLETITLQMNQLFYNLIGNGLKFSKKNVPPKIDINSRKLTEKEVGEHETLRAGSSYVEITVKDNGIGFEQKYEEQIFTIFQRLNQPLDYKGTGIGLALVKRVVENHHGKIFARSKKGKGAVFHVVLPMRQPVADPMVMSVV